MVKINIHIENFIKLLTQLQNSQDNIVNIAESRCFIPNNTNIKFKPAVSFLMYVLDKKSLKNF